MKSKITPSEDTLLKQVKKGTFRNQYLIYNRKSTDEPNNQKNSITYQKKENRRFSKRSQLPIAPISLNGFCADGVISERHSGFKESNDVLFTREGFVQYKIERPKFQKMLQMLNKGYFKGLVCLSWDRISRNKGDDAILRKLMRKGVDVRFTYATYDNTSSGALHMDIDGMFSAHHSRVTSEKVSLATRNLRQQGICTYRAPLGYLNQGSMNSKPFDPDRAPHIKELFMKYAYEGYSLNDLARFSAEVGLQSQPMRRRRTEEELLLEEEQMVDIPKICRPLTPNHVSRILKNPFYVGKIKTVEGDYVDSISHKALIDPTTFNKVQELLKKRQTSIHYTNKIPYPFRGMIRCGDCHRVYTPYQKKGIVYYRARCNADCNNEFKNFNLDFIETETEKVLNKINFNKEEVAKFQAYAETDIALLEERRHRELNTLESKKKRIRKELAYLNSNKLSLLQSGVYELKDFMEEHERLNHKLEELNNQEHISDTAMRDLMRDVVKLSELIKNVTEYYDFANHTEKEKVLRTLFTELYISDERVNYKVMKGLECLETCLNAVCEQNAVFSELLLDSPKEVTVCEPKAWIVALINQKEDIEALISSLEELLGES
ncbi:recombinase family protein [Bizionia sp.]|uniref:recombinase family protein n=1 Tax=Bizionia sp. TaxID=1954480 RepID=UPI003A94890D